MLLLLCVSHCSGHAATLCDVFGVFVLLLFCLYSSVLNAKMLISFVTLNSNPSVQTQINCQVYD